MPPVAKWISVEERLPKSGSYFIYTGNDLKDVHLAYVYASDDSIDLITDLINPLTVELHNFTHWREFEFPTPPV